MKLTRGTISNLEGSALGEALFFSGRHARTIQDVTQTLSLREHRLAGPDEGFGPGTNFALQIVKRVSG